LLVGTACSFNEALKLRSIVSFMLPRFRSGRDSCRGLHASLSGRRSQAARASKGGGGMASILTAEDVVRRIAAECVFVDERGAVGIRLKPAAAIVRLYGNQFRTPRRRRRPRPPKPPPLL